jgi:hypothetical protein
MTLLSLVRTNWKNISSFLRTSALPEPRRASGD